MEKEPLVSVGIPCYNRPEGLRRTLECITKQTYRNLEIIISDNCSPDPDVEKIGREYAEKDKRVRYIKQIENIGAWRNFQFVLDKANGEYFMWTADDDECLLEFVEINLKCIGDASSCFADYIIIRNRFKNQEKIKSLPPISSEKNSYENALIFLNRPSGSLIYGFYKTNSIRWTTKLELFDFFEYIFSLKQIIEYKFSKLHSPLYIKGIDTEEYISKPLNPKNRRLFVYMPFFKSTLRYIIDSKKLKITQKLNLVYELISFTLGNFLRLEKDKQPLKVLLLKCIILPIHLILAVRKKILYND